MHAIAGHNSDISSPNTKQLSVLSACHRHPDCRSASQAAKNYFCSYQHVLVKVHMLVFIRDTSPKLLCLPGVNFAALQGS